MTKKTIYNPLQGVLDELRCGVLDLATAVALSVIVQSEAATSLPSTRTRQLIHAAARVILSDLDRLHRDRSAPPIRANAVRCLVNLCKLRSTPRACL